MVEDEGGRSTLISFVVNLEPIQTDHKQLPLPAFHKQDVTFLRVLQRFKMWFMWLSFITVFTNRVSVVLLFIFHEKKIIGK